MILIWVILHLNVNAYKLFYLETLMLSSLGDNLMRLLMPWHEWLHLLLVFIILSIYQHVFRILLVMKRYKSFSVKKTQILNRKVFSHRFQTQCTPSKKSHCKLEFLIKISFKIFSNKIQSKIYSNHMLYSILDIFK